MAKFKITDNVTGKSVTVAGDTAPTEDESEQIFVDAGLRGVNVEGLGDIPISQRALTPEQRTQATQRIEEQKQRNIEIGIEKAKQELPETIGGVLGGVGGALIGRTPTTTRVGAGLGSAAGGGLGELFREFISGEEIQPLEITKAGGRQAAFEIGGQLVTGIATKVLAPFKKSITPEAVVAQNTLDKFMPETTSRFKSFFGIKGKKFPSLLPAEATENRVLDIIENVSESSLIGGKKIADFKDIIRPKAVNAMVDDMVELFGKSTDPDVLGDMVVSAVEKRWQPHKLLAQKLYNTVSHRTRDKTVNTINLKSFANNIFRKSKPLKGIESEQAGDNLIQAVLDLPNNIPVSTAQDLRARLISKVDEFSITNKKAPAIGKAKKMISLVDEAVENELKKDPEALFMWRGANDIWKRGNEQFNNKFIRSLIKESVDKGNASAIAPKIFKRGAIENIRRIKSSVDEPTWKQLKSFNVDNLLKQSVNADGELIGKNFSNQMFGKAGLGENVMKEIYSPKELTALRNVATTLEVIQKKQAEGLGRMAIQLTQVSALVGLFDERSRPFSIAILGTPAVMARALTNPTFAKLLIQGAKLPARSEQAVAIIGKLGNLANNIRSEMIKNNELPPSELDLEQVPSNVQQLRGQSTISPRPNILQQLGGQ